MDGQISRKKQKAIEGFMRTPAEWMANKGEEKSRKKDLISGNKRND